MSQVAARSSPTLRFVDSRRVALGTAFKSPSFVSDKPGVTGEPGLEEDDASDDNGSRDDGGNGDDITGDTVGNVVIAAA